jgi:hypothetical protein
VLLLPALAAATYSYSTCGRGPDPGDGKPEFRFLDIQYPAMEGAGQDLAGPSTRPSFSSEREGSRPSYFPARLSSGNSSGRAVRRAELLTAGCVWPLIALLASAIASLGIVIAILVTIANIVK